MALRLPPHSHCLRCEAPVSEGEEFCSEGCALAQAASERSERRRGQIGYIALGALALALLSLRLIL